MRRDPFVDRYGPWALVAGASEGLGAAWASALAARGLNLVLVARRAELLQDLAARLRRDDNIDVRVAPLDLGAPDLLARVRPLIEDIDVGFLVYNAAYAHIGSFLEQDLDDALKILDVNCRGPLILSHEIGRRLARRGRGGIVLMTSIAGSQGSPLIAAYAASKGWNTIFAEGLWDELRAHGVDVLACRAGATRTPNYETSRPASEMAPVMEPEAVVDSALAALGHAPSAVPGLANNLAAFFMERLLPRRLAVRVMGMSTRRMYGK